MESEVIKNLKDKLDALFNKAVELSEDLNENQRNKVIKKVIDDSIDKALENIEKDDADTLTQEELAEREIEIRTFIERYFKRRLNLNED